MQSTKETSLELKTNFINESIIPMIGEFANVLSQLELNAATKKNKLKDELQLVCAKVAQDKENLNRQYQEAIETLDKELELVNVSGSEISKVYERDKATKARLLNVKLEGESALDKQIEEANIDFAIKVQALDQEIATLKQQIEKFLNDAKWFNQASSFELIDYPKELKQRFQFVHHKDDQRLNDFNDKKSLLSTNLTASLMNPKRCQTASTYLNYAALVTLSPVLALGLWIALIGIGEIILKLMLIGILMEISRCGHAFDAWHQMINNSLNLIHIYGPYLAIAAATLLIISAGLYLYGAFQDKAPQLKSADILKENALAPEHNELFTQSVTKAFG